MNGIDIFDGHCDTILACLLHGVGFTRNGGHLDLERAGAYRRYAQFFALYGEPEDFPEPLSFREIFDREYALFRREAEANAGRVSLCTTATEAETAFAGGRVAAFLSVEGAELLDCSPERLEQAHALGVSRGIDPFMTLSFMALPVIPSLRLTTRGVFDVTTQSYV